MKKLLRAFILATILTLLVGSVAFAIAQPDTTPTITQTNAYRHCIEQNDQMYLITFNLDSYSSNPTESASEAFIVRLLSSDNTELGVATPYATTINDDGWDTGVVTIYFSASAAPTWQGTYTIELTGNPSLSWTGGDPPRVTSTTFASWSSSTTLAATTTELTARVRYLADAFEEDWSSDLIELSGDGTTKLTTNGERYFQNSISYLRDICPDIFSATITVAEFEEREYTQTYATTMEGRWDTGNTTDFLNFTDLGNTLGLSRMWTTSVLWVILSVGICFAASIKIQSYRIVAFMFAMLLVVGACIGLMPFVVAPIVGALGLLAIIYTVAWGGAS
jgi:hypothetical protein